MRCTGLLNHLFLQSFALSVPLLETYRDFLVLIRRDRIGEFMPKSQIQILLFFFFSNILVKIKT